MKSIIYLLQTTPAKIILAIILALFCTDAIPLVVKQFCYGLSLTIQNILVVFIPIIIFGSMFNAISNIAKGSLFIILLLMMVILSNFTSVVIAEFVGNSFIDSNQSSIISNINSAKSQNLTPLWVLTIPKIISNDLALFISFALALLYRVHQIAILKKTATLANSLSKKFLHSFFLPILPIFVFGFMVKMINDNVISEIITSDIDTLIIMISTMSIYLFLLLICALYLYKNKSWQSILSNMLPPVVTGFASMSSTAALPLSIEAAKKNTQDDDIASAVMPATANIHMIGDSISVPILALMFMNIFHMPLPNIDNYLLFALFFVITKFSGAGIPGGTIIIMIPVLEKYLGFTSEMSGMITVFYMLIDPLTTMGNVFGNNIFVLFFAKIYHKIHNILTRKEIKKDKLVSIS